MINKKYKPITIIKQRQHKTTEQAVLNNQHILILKSYPINQSSSIQNEIQVYSQLKQPHLHGFAQIIEVFQSNGRLYLAMNELGPNLSYLRVQCGGRLSLKTVLMIGIQMIDRIKYLHRSGFLHKDIKPDNFVIGVGKFKHKIYLIDFELSQSYRVNGKHIQEETLQSFSGSLLFSSQSSNCMRNISRKDQIQSIYYSMIYLLKGILPWQHIEAKTIPDAYHVTAHLKQSKLKQLLEGLPDIFTQLFQKLKNTKFYDEPNYDEIKQSLSNLMKKNGYELDYKYDWQYL